jgi:hypothetical protein
MQCLQQPNKSKIDNMKNVGHEASRNFRNKKKEYVKGTKNELETNSKIRNIRGFIGASMTLSLELIQ